MKILRNIWNGEKTGNNSIRLLYNLFYGFEVFTSELDDHGVDFIAHHPKDNTYYEIQVKSIRDYNYAFVKKDKM